MRLGYLPASAHASCLPTALFATYAFYTDSAMLLTACDDMHVNLYDVENKSLIESFSGKHVNMRKLERVRVSWQNRGTLYWQWM
jgi:hypothetical protein